MVSQAIELIYYTWKKTLQFLMSATIGSDGVGSVSLLFIMFAVFLFGILFRFFLSVPRTYRGESDNDKSLVKTVDLGGNDAFDTQKFAFRYRGGFFKR